MKKYINVILRVGIAITMWIVIYLQYTEIKELRVKSQITPDIVLTNQIDSLRNELFTNEMQVARYEITLELLKEQNQKAANEFELIFRTQTE
jgi:hypothetical protein